MVSAPGRWVSHSGGSQPGPACPLVATAGRALSRSEVRRCSSRVRTVLSRCRGRCRAVGQGCCTAVCAVRTEPAGGAPGGARPPSWLRLWLSPCRPEAPARGAGSAGPAGGSDRPRPRWGPPGDAGAGGSHGAGPALARGPLVSVPPPRRCAAGLCGAPAARVTLSLPAPGAVAGVRVRAAEEGAGAAAAGGQREQRGPDTRAPGSGVAVVREKPGSSAGPRSWESGFEQRLPPLHGAGASVRARCPPPWPLGSAGRCPARAARGRASPSPDTLPSRSWPRHPVSCHR